MRFPIALPGESFAQPLLICARNWKHIEQSEYSEFENIHPNELSGLTPDREVFYGFTKKTLDLSRNCQFANYVAPIDLCAELKKDSTI